MPINLNRNSWLEAEQPPFPTDQPGFAATTPTSDPTTGATGGPPAMPQGGGENQPDPDELPDDVTQDPQDPEIPEDSSPQDFEEWRHEFFELSIKGDTNEMMASIEPMRNAELKESSQKKFVEDNIQILFYRQSELVIPATKEIRKLIKDDLDRTNPGTTVMQHITTVLEKQGLLQQVLIKLTGLYGLKNDLHRKFIAALTGSVQVGGGGKNREDLIFTDTEYTINISTRMATQFGEVNLGNWSLKEDDPERFLTEPELDRLSEGSPEEKQVLRRRIICESIAKKFSNRAFVIHIVDTDGTIHSIGWDLGTSLLEAYKKGKIVVRGQKSETRDAMINDQGQIIPVIDVEILYVMDTDETDDSGKPVQVEMPFIERRDSTLYMSCDLETLHNAASSMSGIFFREMPYGGNPSDLDIIRRCTPDLVEMLNRRCIGNTVPLPSNIAALGTNKPTTKSQEKVSPMNSKNVL